MCTSTLCSVFVVMMLSVHIMHIKCLTWTQICVARPSHTGDPQPANSSWRQQQSPGNQHAVHVAYSNFLSCTCYSCRPSVAGHPSELAMVLHQHLLLTPNKGSRQVLCTTSLGLCSRSHCPATTSHTHRHSLRLLLQHTPDTALQALPHMAFIHRLVLTDS